MMTELRPTASAVSVNVKKPHALAGSTLKMDKMVNSVMCFIKIFF